MKIIQKVLFIVIPCVMITYALFQLGFKTVNMEAVAAQSEEGNIIGQLMQKTGSADDKYAAMDTFLSVLGLVSTNYVEPINEKEAIYGAIKGMLEELDPHSSFMTPEEFSSFRQSTSGSFGGLGITITMKNDLLTIMNALEDTPAWKAGVKAGDVIALIDGEPTANMTLDDAVKRMRGKAGSKIKLTIARKGEEKPIDLRNNGGGLLNEAVSIASIFLPINKTVVFTRERDKQEKHYKTEAVNVSSREVPMVILVNEWSASASEIIAGAMQDYKRAVIVGKSTFGKGSVQSIIPLTDGSAVRLTTSRYYTPNGVSIQGVGIKPDVEIEPGTIEYTSDYHVIKEKDLSGHLKGENEKDKNASNTAFDEAVKRVSQVLPLDDDLQYISAVQILKGMIVYGNKTNK